MRPSIPYIQACFDDYNARFFRSELPPVPIRLSNATGFLGKLTFTRRRTSLFGPYRNTDFVLRINTRIDLPEPVVQDTILHEMIHYYIAVRQLRDTATHGTLFRREMQRINAEGNRHITISHRLSPDEQQQSLVRKGRLVAHVFFRDGSIIKVHVHTRTPGEILNHCQLYGEFLTVKVENMTLQHHENHMEERFRQGRKAFGVVAVASGTGLTDTFKELGADVVIEGGQTMNPPVERFLRAFDTVDADTVFVLPDNSNILLTARQAADLYDKSDIRVIPCKTLGEGYYALANLDTESGDADAIEAALTEAVSEVKTGLVSRAIRDSGTVHEGDFIGISGKDILAAGPTPEEALLALAESMGAASSDVLLVFAGAGGTHSKRLQEDLARKYPRAEVILSSGGQPVYDYILVLF